MSTLQIDFGHAEPRFGLRLAALRSQCLSLAKIGLRSGEYFGRKNSLAPTERMARRNALLAGV